MPKLGKVACFILILVGFILDQASKYAVVSEFQLGDVKSVFPGFNLTLSHNPGIAFGWLNGGQTTIQWLLLLVIVAITLSLVVWLIRTPPFMKIQALALSLIISGALGNLCDRIVRGYVVDFLDFYYQSWHFHTFNLADSFISVGAVLLILSTFIYREKT